MATPINALYVADDSIYYRLLDKKRVWNKERDARRFAGDGAVIAHPPCAPYCRLAHMANKDAARKSCARIAVWQVRRNGGILEHPAYSRLWNICKLPMPGGLDRDEYGGWTLAVRQYDFGHVAAKKTWLYIVGVDPNVVMPMLPKRRIGTPHAGLWTPEQKTVGRKRKRSPQKKGRNKLRIHTPIRFAKFLIAVCSRINASRKKHS